MAYASWPPLRTKGPLWTPTSPTCRRIDLEAEDVANAVVGEYHQPAIADRVFPRLFPGVDKTADYCQLPAWLRGGAPPVEPPRLCA